MDSINTNLASLYAQNNLGKSQSSVATSIQRLSSGLRINSAADDAAGYAISQNMTTQISGDNQAALNASNGVSLSQTAQGDMSTILTNLQTMYGLAVEASNATNTSADRVALNDQMQQLLQQNDLTAKSSNFNGVSLLNGTFNGETFQVGANNSTNDQISISGISSMLNTALGGSGTSYQSAVTGTATTAALAAGDLTLNGFQVGASTIGSGAGQSADSAYSIAQAINAVSSQSSVQATANATALTSTLTAVTAVTANSFSINGVNIGAIAAGGTVAGEAANTAAAINLLSAQTGVTATANATTGGLTLTAADGRDIKIAAVGTGTPPAGLATGTTNGTISLTSTSSSGITVGGAAPGSAGLAAGTTAPATTLNVQSLSTTDLLTQTDAQNAMTAIQGAINTVTANAAQMGALQNRFSAVVTGIQTDSQNLSTSLSAIQDTNYAAETANLSREQVLSQAGTAMLAQANQLPNQVLTLLR